MDPSRDRACICVSQGHPQPPPRAQGNRRRGAATAPNQPPDGLIDPWVPPESGPGLQTRPSARTGSPDAFSSRRTGPTCGRRKSSRSESAKQSRFPGAGARALLQASSGHVCNTFVFDKWWSSGAPPRRHEGILEHDSIFSSRATLTPCTRTKSPFSPRVRGSENCAGFTIYRRGKSVRSTRRNGKVTRISANQ